METRIRWWPLRVSRKYLLCANKEAFVVSRSFVGIIAPAKNGQRFGWDCVIADVCLNRQLFLMESTNEQVSGCFDSFYCCYWRRWFTKKIRSATYTRLNTMEVGAKRRKWMILSGAAWYRFNESPRATNQPKTDYCVVIARKVSRKNVQRSHQSKSLRSLCKAWRENFVNKAFYCRES